MYRTKIVWIGVWTGVSFDQVGDGTASGCGCRLYFHRIRRSSVSQRIVCHRNVPEFRRAVAVGTSAVRVLGQEASVLRLDLPSSSNINAWLHGISRDTYAIFKLEERQAYARSFHGLKPSVPILVNPLTWTV